MSVAASGAYACVPAQSRERPSYVCPWISSGYPDDLVELRIQPLRLRNLQSYPSSYL